MQQKQFIAWNKRQYENQNSIKSQLH